jgi:hypothetical protein
VPCAWLGNGPVTSLGRFRVGLTGVAEDDQCEDHAQQRDDRGADRESRTVMSATERSWPQESKRRQPRGPQVASVDSRRFKSQAVNADSASRTTLMRSVLGAGVSPRSVRAILSSADTLSSRNSIRSSKFMVFCASFIPTSLLSSKAASSGQRRLCAVRATSTPNRERVRSPLHYPHLPGYVFNENKGFLSLYNICSLKVPNLPRGQEALLSGPSTWSRKE